MTELYFICYANQHGRLTTTCSAHKGETADQQLLLNLLQWIFYIIRCSFHFLVKVLHFNLPKTKAKQASKKNACRQTKSTTLSCLSHYLTLTWPVFCGVHKPLREFCTVSIEMETINRCLLYSCYFFHVVTVKPEKSWFSQLDGRSTTFRLQDQMFSYWTTGNPYRRKDSKTSFTSRL